MIKKPSLKIYSSFSTNIIPRLQTSNSSLTKERARTKFPLTFRILSKFIPKISRFYTGNATTKGSRVLHPKTFIPKSIRIPAKKHDHPLPFSFSRCRFKNQFQPKEKKNPSLVPFSLLRTFWFEPPSPSFPLQKLVPRIVLVKETGWQEGKVRATSSSNRFLQLTSPSRFFFYEPFNPPWDQRNSLSRTSSLWQDAPTCASWTSFNCCLRTRLFYVFARLPGRNLAEDRLNLCRIMLFRPPPSCLVHERGCIAVLKGGNLSSRRGEGVSCWSFGGGFPLRLIHSVSKLAWHCTMIREEVITEKNRSVCVEYLIRGRGWRFHCSRWIELLTELGLEIYFQAKRIIKLLTLLEIFVSFVKLKIICIILLFFLNSWINFVIVVVWRMNYPRRIIIGFLFSSQKDFMYSRNWQ